MRVCKSMSEILIKDRETLYPIFSGVIFLVGISSQNATFKSLSKCMASINLQPVVGWTLPHLSGFHCDLYAFSLHM